MVAFLVAALGDAAQLLLGPVGIFGIDEAIDVAVMIAVSVLIGFHPLFLPTFIAEFLPLVDMLPTWTGCVAVVVALRRRREREKPGVFPGPDVIDI